MFPIVSFTDQGAATQAASALEEQGVETQIVVESDTDADDIYVLRVSDHDDERAVAFLREQFGRSKRSSKGVVACPSCGSFYIEYPCAPQHSITGNLVERVAEWVHAKKKAFFCKACSHVWIQGEGSDGPGS